MPEKCVLRKKACLCTHSKTVSAGVCVFTSDQSREEMLKRSIKGVYLKKIHDDAFRDRYVTAEINKPVSIS